ncbi:CRISPR system precrRNA processing endoribonuclease RAMP protein Cas6 [Pseudonocardia oroxyli]|uniref:CRISPR-associated endoribonuclease Cas6 n=1 Tax=Pseudonocardia oroxyli TaxID=366584 RepID=A0A1G8CR16_PSEOR|nr:CRISPR system precrRNA processing endoribonuclease RAMP protein Cas6 [Pseudonocardia oroxyli]SDH47872.1 CRISPR-associated endoribonuclease Cas6 [Pseudonocardia oroxyli]
MPAIIELLVDATDSLDVYPARLHGAACAVLGHPAPGRPPAFAVRPPAATGDGYAVWRLGWLAADTSPPLPDAVRFGDRAHRVVASDVASTEFGELAGRAPVRRARIEVVSPLYFSRGDRDLALPEPELMVQSLLNRWERFAPAAFSVPPALRADLLSSVYLVEMDGHTVSAPVGKVTMQTGYLGSVVLGLNRKADTEVARLFAALLGFAEIAGIGAQTGHGFGAVDVEPVELPPVRHTGRGRRVAAR